MDGLTVIVSLVVIAVSVALAAVARYSIRPTSFEDAVPAYSIKNASDGTSSKPNRKKTKKSTDGKKPDRKAAANVSSNETESDEDTEDNESEENRKKASKQKRKKVSEENQDLLEYSRYFNSDLTSKVAAAAKASAVAKQKPQVAKQLKVKGSADQVTQNSVTVNVQQAKPTVDRPAVIETGTKATVRGAVKVQSASTSVNVSSRPTPVQKGPATNVAAPKPSAVSVSSKNRNKPVAVSEEKLKPAHNVSTDKPTAASSTSDGWETKSHKGDPTVVLKKQLDDKETALSDALQQVHAVNNKNAELRTELAALKAKISTLEQQRQQSKTTAGAEIDAHTKRVQHTHQQQVTAGASSPQAGTPVDSAATQKQAANQNDEKDKKIRVLEDALKQNVMLFNTSDNARKTLESKLKQSEEQVKKLETKIKEADELHSKKVEELSENLMKLEARNRSLLQDAEETKKSKSANLQEQLKEKERLMSKMESEMKTLESKFADLEKIIETKDQELQKFVDQIAVANSEIVRLNGETCQVDRLENELQTSRRIYEEKINVQEQALNAMNAELNETKDKGRQLEELLSEKGDEFQKIIADLSSSNKHLEEQLNEKDDMLSEVKKEIDLLNQELFRLDQLCKEKSEEVEKLGSELDQCKRDLDLSKEQINSRDKVLSSVTGELDESNARLVHLEKVCGERDDEIRRLLTEQENARKTNSDELAAAVADINAELNRVNQELELQRNEKTEEVHRLTADFESCKNNLHETQERLNEQLTALSAANEEIGKSKEQIDHLEKLCTEKNDEIHRLMTDLENSKKASDEQLAGKNNSLSDALQQIDRLQQEISHLNQQCSSKSDEIHRLTSELDSCRKDFEERFSALETKLSTADSQLHESTEQLERLRGEKNDEIRRLTEDFESSRRALNEELTAKNNSLSDASNEINRKNDEISRLDWLYHEKIAEVDRLTAEVSRLDWLYHEKIAEVDRLTAEVSRLDWLYHEKIAEAARLTEECHSCKRDLESTQEKLTNASSSLSQNAIEIDRLNQELSRVCNEKTEDTQRLSADLDDCRRNLASSQDQINSLGHTISSITSELDRSRAEIDRLNGICAQKEDEVNRLQVGLDDIRRSYEDELARERNDSIKSRDQHQAEEQHYKTVLAETEQVLRDLQHKTEATEEEWRLRIETSANLLREAEEEIKRLKDEIDDLRSHRELTLTNGNASNHELQEGDLKGSNHVVPTEN